MDLKSFKKKELIEMVRRLRLEVNQLKSNENQMLSQITQRDHALSKPQGFGEMQVTQSVRPSFFGDCLELTSCVIKNGKVTTSQRQIGRDFLYTDEIFYDIFRHNMHDLLAFLREELKR